MDKVIIKGFEFALIYADDHERSVEFYKKYFGFEIQYTMPDGACYGKAGEVDLWIGKDYQTVKNDERSVRFTVMLRIDSSSKLFNWLKEDGVKIYQDAPQEMQAGNFWFQFQDPSGNIVDTLGSE